jgi:BRCT domain type II-containing protein
VTKTHVAKSTRASSSCIVDSDDEENTEKPEEPEENEDVETAEDILTRQVALVTPAQAKAAAEKVLEAKKKVTFAAKTTTAEVEPVNEEFAPDPVEPET